MKNIVFFFAFVFASLFFVQRSDAQCYVRLEDASGFNTDEYQDTLQAAAAKLCAIFDTTGFEGQFKVYDFGFYLHQENTTGGYPEPFAQKIAEVQGLSPYYLLFGKQTDKSGVYTKFWVDLVLPDTGEFVCLQNISNNLEESIKQKIIISTNLKYEAVYNSYDKYSEVEIYITESLKTLLADFLTCCNRQSRGGESCTPCIFTPAEIKQYYEKKGFTAFEITLNPGSARRDSTMSEIDFKTGNIVTLHDYANTTVNIFNNQFNLGQGAYSDYLNYPAQGLNIKILVSNNETFCNNFEEIDADLNSSSYDIFSCYHIWRENPSSNEAILFYKVDKNIPPLTGNFVFSYIYLEPPVQNTLSSLLDFETIRLTTSIIFGDNEVYFPVVLGDKSPLTEEDCWIKIVDQPLSAYPYPGLTSADGVGTVDKSGTYANYKSTMEKNNGLGLTKQQKSYLMGWVIAHEFLHQLLIKAYALVVTADGKDGVGLLAGNIFREGVGIHYDCNINLNTSGPWVTAPYEEGQNPNAEKISDYHKILINQYFECINTREIYGANSQTYTLLVWKYKREFTDRERRLLLDGCLDPVHPGDYCNCSGN